MRFVVGCGSFEVGEQPCGSFRALDSLFPGSGNVHECFAPFDKPGLRCAEMHNGRVSFCENCNRDHHNNGWQTCAGRAPEGTAGQE